jgi:hypothetical protein
MSTLDERLMIGLKMLDRFRPSLRARRGRIEQASPAKKPSSKADELLAEIEMADDSINSSARGEGRQEAPIQETDEMDSIVSLEMLLEKAGKLAPYSMILGLCEDGLPCLLELTNPAPGALLLSGDTHSGKTRLLRAILASAIRLNTPDQVAFYLVAHQPKEYRDLAESDHCRQVNAADEKVIPQLIEELAALTEQRRRGKLDGPAIILAIDDLAVCLESLDNKAFTRLYWLIRHGPRSQVWTLATLGSGQSKKIDPRFLTAFRTRLMGHVSDRRLANVLSGDNRLDARELQSGYQFCVPFGDEWLRFWICEPETDLNTPEEEENENEQ